MIATSPRHAYDESTSGQIALGIAGFAGIMLATVSVFQILQGISAVAGDDVYAPVLDYAYDLDLDAWGWTLVVLGAIGLATGLGILSDRTWARMAGIVISVFGAMTSFAFLPYYPAWSLVVVGFHAAVVWALCLQISRDPV